MIRLWAVEWRQRGRTRLRVFDDYEDARSFVELVDAHPDARRRRWWEL